MSEPARPAPTTPRFRSVLDRIVGFTPAKAVVSPQGRSYPLAANENPYGPLPSVVEAIREEALAVNRYPDNHCVELIAALAARLGVAEDEIAVGTGSVDVTRMLLEAVAEPGAEVVHAWRSFEAYPFLIGLSGATPVEVPLRDGAHDLPAMADAITARTRLVLVCNPNNPTGSVVRRGELEAFLDRVPADCLVVVDEAYHEYVRDAEVPDALTLRAGRPHLVVLRTFSKAYGLAGLRVGYAVGHPVAIAAIRKAFVPFGVSGLAQAAALAALRAGAELTARVDVTTAERARVRAALTEQGWSVDPSEANFLWLPLGEQALAFAAHCAEAGVAVRAFAGDGVRVSIGSAEENDAFLAATAALAAVFAGD
ncbi:histidinol-phosphate transaminase [Streptomyces sp. NPDC048606]|uniref:histidinol-phosphate transaminase n=1 Tax=Streptomyces sp. NPDC048606 TaxID=3154726 RepID=UPI003431109D